MNRIYTFVGSWFWLISWHSEVKLLGPGWPLWDVPPCHVSWRVQDERGLQGGAEMSTQHRPLCGTQSAVSCEKGLRRLSWLRYELGICLPNSVSLTFFGIRGPFAKVLVLGLHPSILIRHTWGLVQTLTFFSRVSPDSSCVRARLRTAAVHSS